MEVVFALLVTSTFVYSLWLARQSYFWSDEWLLIRQSGSASGLFDQYNGHLSVLILANYRVLAALFGFAYTPFRVAGLVSLLAVPSAYFLTTRRQVGAPLAALLAFPLLWYGHNMSLYPGELNHYLVLVGAIGCAAVLNRGRRADWVLAAALTFALCSAGGGVAVAVACLVHSACTRPHRRRWLVVVVPTLVWLGWWLIVVGHPATRGAVALSTSEKLLFIRDLSFTPFDGAGLGFSPVVVGLMLAFVGYGTWVVSKGLKVGANFIAWSTGLLAWGLGLSSSLVRANPEVFRYRYVALGLALLAIVPRRPIRWPARFPIDTDRRWARAAAGVVLAIGSVRALAVRGDMQDFATQHAAIGQRTRGETLVVGLGKTVVPDEQGLSFRFGTLRAGEVRALLAAYGNPFSATLATADQQLVDINVVRSQPDGTRNGPCKPLSEPFSYQPTGFGNQFVWSPDRNFVVDVRRFGGRWVRLGEGHPGEALKLVLPDLVAAKPWEVRADGACKVGPEPH